MKTIFAAVCFVLMGVGVVHAEPHTVEGKIHKVVPSETEIYVLNEADGKKYEYYFNADTKVMRKGEAAKFEDLKKGQKVKVVADRQGKKFNPQTVDILE